MSHRSGESSYTPGLGNYCYALYTYDPGSRLGSVAYGAKKHTTGNNYTDFPLKNYEAFYGARGLKTSVTTSVVGDWGSVDTAKTQTYGYEAERDYLASATYFSGTHTWAYDSAGNRNNQGGNTSFAYDYLNRMTVSPDTSGTHVYSNDVLGNRLTLRLPWTAASAFDRSL